MFARGVYQQHDIVRLVLGVWILDLHSSDKVLIDLKGPHYVKKKRFMFRANTMFYFLTSYFSVT